MVAAVSDVYQLIIQLERDDYKTLIGLEDIADVAVPGITTSEVAAGVLSRELRKIREKMPRVLEAAEVLKDEGPDGKTKNQR